MPYRDSDRLGKKLSEHRISAGGAASWFGGGLLGFAFCPLFLYLSASGHEFSPKLALGGIMMGVIGAWAFHGWWQMRGIALGLHERGLSYRSNQTTSLEVLWEEITTLEGRYALGARKRGTADEGNRRSTHAHTR